MAAGSQTFLDSALAKLGLRSSPRLYYIVPGVNWVLDWVGQYVTTNVERNHHLKASVVRSAKNLRGQIVHYGSLWDLAANIDEPHHERNWTVGTIFHGQKDQPSFNKAISRLLEKQSSFEKIHTASRIMEQRLLKWGIPSEKVVRIPLGVDLERFRPVSADQRAAARKALGIGEDVICIGSFHKDGVGMQEGNEPKLIKGPDIFLQVVEQLAKKYSVFVLLSAPARGYVKRGLDAIKVPYSHQYKEDFHEIPALYRALDLYLITSREEGGPEGVLESMASGIPLVTTKVGLAPDVVENRGNGMLANVEDVSGLVKAASEVIEGKNLRDQLVSNALKTIVDYDWKKIANQYYHLLYEPILSQIS
jgi:glycosyltransferase involved in cell wall biosynthesis